MQQPAQLLPDLARLYEAPRLFLRPDLRWCAVSFEIDGNCIAGEHYRLCLYHIHADRLVHILHRGIVGGYIINWTPCSTRLLVLTGVNEHYESDLVVCEAATGCCTKPEWTMQAAAIIEGMKHTMSVICCSPQTADYFWCCTTRTPCIFWTSRGAALLVLCPC